MFAATLSFRCNRNTKQGTKEESKQWVPVFVFFFPLFPTSRKGRGRCTIRSLCSVTAVAFRRVRCAASSAPLVSAAATIAVPLRPVHDNVCFSPAINRLRVGYLLASSPGRSLLCFGFLIRPPPCVAPSWPRVPLSGPIAFCRVCCAASPCRCAPSVRRRTYPSFAATPSFFVVCPWRVVCVGCVVFLGWLCGFSLLVIATVYATFLWGSTSDLRQAACKNMRVVDSADRIRASGWEHNRKRLIPAPLPSRLNQQKYCEP